MRFITGRLAPKAAKGNPPPIDLARVFEQGETGRSRGHAMALAHEERRSHGLFQLGQPLADGGWNDAGPVTGTRDVPRFAYGGKQPEGGQVEVAH